MPGRRARARRRCRDRGGHRGRRRARRGRRAGRAAGGPRRRGGDRRGDPVRRVAERGGPFRVAGMGARGVGRAARVLGHQRSGEGRGHAGPGRVGGRAGRVRRRRGGDPGRRVADLRLADRARGPRGDRLDCARPAPPRGAQARGPARAPLRASAGRVEGTRKLVLVVVDSLHTGMLERAVDAGAAPTFKKLIDRGTLIRGCVSTFPSVTPVACSEIATGVAPDRHWVSGMNWYHRVERRYVEYGTSLEATRAFGLFRTLYDTVYNMNMAHLSHEVETVFERLGDAGVRTACTPFLIYRGRRRHELSLEGLLRRVAVAASFRHAVWGPDELFYGELYASRRVPCKPTLRPGTRDAYSGCVSRELIADDGYDFLLFSLPDNDHYTHTHGIAAMRDSITHADRSFGDLVDAAGGIGAFCESHSVILMADHAQTDVQHEVPIAAALGADWHVMAPNSERPELAQLAVSPTARAAGVYALAQGRRRERMLGTVIERLRDLDGIDLITRVETGNGAAEAVVERAGAELRFQPGSHETDRRGAHWS